jgi:lysozyme
MKASQKAIDLIKEFEEFRSKAYLCPAGKWTIGYGHTKGVKPNDIIDMQTAEKFLAEDLEWAENAINKYCLDLNQNQFDALVSFVFNVGSGNFSRSTLLKKIKANPNDFSIRNEFMRWIYADGKPLNGLKRRREKEANLYFDNKNIS